MVTLANRVKVDTATTGTGTVTLGTAVDGYQTFAAAGVADGDTVRYVIEDAGNAWEIGSGVFDATAGTMTRVVSESSNSGSAINLSGAATVFLTVTAEDLIYANETTTTFTATSGQTTFTDTYTVGLVQVYLNGVRLIEGTDYTATNGTDVVLATGATAGDIVQVTTFQAVNVVDETGNQDYGLITGAETVFYDYGSITGAV